MSPDRVDAARRPRPPVRAQVPAIGVAAPEGHATHEEHVAAVAALLAAARRGGGAGATPVPAAAERHWRGVRLAALGLTSRRR